MYQNARTPVMYAAGNGFLTMVEYLEEKGADMEARDVVSIEISFV